MKRGASYYPLAIKATPFLGSLWQSGHFGLLWQRRMPAIALLRRTLNVEENA